MGAMGEEDGMELTEHLEQEHREDSWWEDTVRLDWTLALANIAMDAHNLTAATFLIEEATKMLRRRV